MDDGPENSSSQRTCIGLVGSRLESIPDREPGLHPDIVDWLSGSGESVEYAPLLHTTIAVGSLLHQRVLEQETRRRRRPALKYEPGIDEVRRRFACGPLCCAYRGRCRRRLPNERYDRFGGLSPFTVSVRADMAASRADSEDARTGPFKGAARMPPSSQKISGDV